jgi:hypothetical protein
MSQRDSGYQRMARDAYETPPWVTEALLPHLPAGLVVWEPACGDGRMARVLKAAGFQVVATDIVTGQDFLTMPAPAPVNAIVTNPPYALAKEFIERPLTCADLVAMLLRCDYDHARGRVHLFGGCRAFAKKLVLTKRVVWFAGPKAAPSFNHAWFLWDRQHSGPATIAYH